MADWPSSLRHAREKVGTQLSRRTAGMSVLGLAGHLAPLHSRSHNFIIFGANANPGNCRLPVHRLHMDDPEDFGAAEALDTEPAGTPTDPVIVVAACRNE